MKILAILKQIPNLADELEINSAGTNLDFDQVDFVLNEFDEQAIEQAVLVKEASGGEVTVMGIDLTGELDPVLHTALAKGADQAAKIAGGFEAGLDSHAQARLLADCIREMSPDLVLTGVQAADDLDGQIGAMLAAHLDMPYIGVVNGLEVTNGVATVRKEYSGGIMAAFEARLPLVVGIQASSQPPRYAPISKIRQVAATTKIRVYQGGETGPDGEIELRKMARPLSAGHAEMLEGGAKEVAAKIIQIIKEQGLL